MLGRFFLNGLAGRAGLIMALLVAVAVAVPLLNALPDGNPFHVADHLVPVWGRYLCYALLAVAVNLVWGYAGILSLGHAAFFALGGYAMAMYLTRQIGARGVYADALLPDFMVRNNYTELPWYWLHFDHFWYAALMVLLVPGVLAFVFGWLAFRSRVSGVYLSIITQAFTYALMLAFRREEMGFGGDTGMNNFRDILGYDLAAPATRLALFSTSAIALALGVFIVAALVRSKFGKVLIAVRDAESRTRFLGYRVEGYKLTVWTLSAVMAGVAGALYVPQIGILNPLEFDPRSSIEAVIWVAIGGRGTFLGPVVGGVVVNGLKSFLTATYADIWLFVLGGLFILVTLLLPRGIVGTVGHGWSALRQRRASSRAAPGTEPTRGDDPPSGALQPGLAE